MKTPQFADSRNAAKPVKAGKSSTARSADNVVGIAGKSTPVARKAVAAAKVAKIELDPAVATPKSFKGKRPAEAGSFSEDELDQMIRQAAYFRAERRGFAAGSEWQDWFEAEQEVYRMLKRALSKH